ncbi:MAG: hypothetical protein M3R50_02365 [Bacteroidota bacterium]|nr:hypothetical protein [Bacteroidota bacterium]
MDFRKLKIGYVPYLPDLSQPGDRRRFPYFAKRNNIPFEIADKNKQYDIILLTASGNLSKWLIYKRKHPGTKFIFEMVDSLIFSPDIFSTFFKGIGRFILRKEDLLFINYKKLIIRWLKTADVVACSSKELKRNIEKWNSSVIVSLDYLEDEYEFIKTNYNINGKMKLLWEGQSVVLRHFLYYKDLFKQLSPFCELHVITIEKYPLFGNLIHRDIEKILSQLPIKTIFYKWDINKNREVFKQCDCGIIPLNKKNIFGWHKPANKLISFWFSGLPTVVSDTPAYVDLMNDANENLYCYNIDEWAAKLKLIKNMTPIEREEISKKNFVYVKAKYSNKVLDSVWFQIFGMFL